MGKPLFQTLLRHKSMSWGMSLIGFFTLIQWLIVGLFIWQLPPEIPLWYSLPAGRSQLSGRDWFILLPSLSLGLLIINLILTKIGLSVNKTFAPMIIWLTTMSVFLITIAMFHIVMLVI